MSPNVNTGRIWTIVHRIGRQIRRDRRTLGLMLVAPLVVTFIFGIMFTGTVANVPTAICVNDQAWGTALGDVIAGNLETNANVTVVQRSLDNAFVGFGTSIQSVLILPTGLTVTLLRGLNTSIGLYVNVTTWPQANYILSTISNATTNSLTEFSGRSGISFDRNVTVLMPAPPVGSSLSFNLSLVNQDIGFPVSIGEAIDDDLSANTNVSLVSCDSRAAVIESIRSESSIVGLYVPENFTNTLLTGGKPTVEIFVNGIETSQASTAVAAIQQALADAAKSVLGRGTDVTITYVYGAAGMSMIQLAGPSVIGFFALFFGFIISGIFFLRERQQGTLERMRASPLSELDVVIGYVIAFIGVSLVQTTIITLVIVYYSPSILSTIGMLIVPIVLLAVQSVTLAIAAAYRMKTELQVMQMIPIYIIPQIFLSGIFFSASLLPSYLSFLPYLFPLTYYVMAVKSVVFYGATLIDIAIPILALTLYAILGVVLAVARRPER